MLGVYSAALMRLPISLRCLLGITTVLVLLSSGTGASTPEAPPPPAFLDFEIVDSAGLAIPGRLTFTAPDGSPAAAFDPAPNSRGLAIRPHVVSTPSGTGRVPVVPGRYTVTASRGLEWSVDVQELALRAGEQKSYRAVLRHEVDTGNWVAADLHLHTQDFSGHSDARIHERIITLLAEGLEVAVATDHDHATDYASHGVIPETNPPLRSVVGIELSSPDGHFNVFPLSQASKPPAPNTSAPELIRQVRALNEVAGTPPLLQVNHPRSGTAYFNQIQLDPVTGTTPLPDGPGDFDLLEVLNQNEGFGYYDSQLLSNPAAHPSQHWALGDWFNLLNRGYRYTAVGNSDSHTVYGDIAGYPRNFVWMPPPLAATPPVSEIARSLRAHRSLISLGPFVELSVNGAPMGSEVVAPGASIELSLRVQAASWVDVDRVKIIINGDLVEEIPVPQTRQPVRLETERTLELTGDSWLILLVEGDDPLHPVIPNQQRPIRPLAVTNPIWVKTLPEGAWTSPWAQAQAWAAKPKTPTLLKSVPPAQRALRLLAAGEGRSIDTPAQIQRGLKDPSRKVRLAAARAAEQTADPNLTGALEAAYTSSAGDPYAQVALLRALASSDSERFRALLLREASATQGESWKAWGGELGRLTPEAFVRDWWVAAFFPPAGSPAAQRNASRDARFLAKGARSTGWQPWRSRKDGFVDLRTPQTPTLLSDNAVAYAQTYLYSPDDREVPAAIGSDDSFELFVEDKRVLSDARQQRAQPWAHYTQLPLATGWNRVVMKVRNGVGDFGFYFQIFDAEVQASLEPTTPKN